MKYVSVNGKLQPASEQVFLADNRSYRYGDGLFETMKMADGKIQLAPYHFERLFSGLSLLKFEIPKLFTAEKLQQDILALCRKNECEKLARIRLSVSGGHGGLYDENRYLQYLVECWPLNGSVNQLNENGLVIDIYPDARKACDPFSNIKSASFLPYTMAALHAKENKLNDCLVMNTHDRVCDSTIANLFWIKDATVFTPALNEGCVAGVMRRHLIGKLREAKYNVQETMATVADIENADEIFLTNAINGIRWVSQFRDQTYSNIKTKEILRITNL
jgi:branched-chain amino acid aminotransferase